MSHTQEIDALMSMPKNREVMIWMDGNDDEMHILSTPKDSVHNIDALDVIAFYSVPWSLCIYREVLAIK